MLTDVHLKPLLAATAQVPSPPRHPSCEQDRLSSRRSQPENTVLLGAILQISGEGTEISGLRPNRIEHCQGLEKLFEAVTVSNLLEAFLSELVKATDFKSGELSKSLPPRFPIKEMASEDSQTCTTLHLETSDTFEGEAPELRVQLSYNITKDQNECDVDSKAKQRAVRLIVEQIAARPYQTDEPIPPLDFEQTLDNLLKLASANFNSTIEEHQLMTAVFATKSVLESMVSRLHFRKEVGNTPGDIFCAPDECRWSTFLEIASSDESMFFELELSENPGQNHEGTVLRKFERAVSDLKDELNRILERRYTHTNGKTIALNSAVEKSTVPSRQSLLHTNDAEQLLSTILQRTNHLPVAHAVLNAAALSYLASLLAQPTPTQAYRKRTPGDKPLNRSNRSTRTNKDSKDESSTDAFDAGLALLFGFRGFKR